MSTRFRAPHLILVVAIVGVFLLYFVGQVAIPSWLLFGLSVFVVVGAAATFIADYRRAGAPAGRADAVTQIEDPRFARFLFNDVRSAPVWLALRLYLGLQWLDAGWGKVTSADWMGGAALRGFWERAVVIPDPPARPAIAYDWYRDFIQLMLDRGWYTWFAPLLAVGQVLVGVGLIVGGLVGIAAAAGLLMNTAFMLAGAASTNPVLGAISILIILGWKVAGYWGIDRYLLPALGAPWSPGWLAQRRGADESDGAAAGASAPGKPAG